MVLREDGDERIGESKLVTQSNKCDNFQVINLRESISVPDSSSEEANKQVSHQVIVIDHPTDSSEQVAKDQLAKQKLEKEKQEYMDKVEYNPASSQAYLPMAELCEVSLISFLLSPTQDDIKCAIRS